MDKALARSFVGRQDKKTQGIANGLLRLYDVTELEAVNLALLYGSRALPFAKTLLRSRPKKGKDK